MRRLEDRLVKISERRGAKAHLVSLGDLVDRGPDSAGVVQHFRRGAEAGTHSAVLGNHEEMMLRCIHQSVPELFEGIPPSRWVITGDNLQRRSPRGPWLTAEEYRELNRLLWQSQGGTPALRSWGQDPVRPSSWWFPEEDLAFLCRLPLLFECEAAVATHALASTQDLLLLRALALAQPGPDVPVSEIEADTFQNVMWRRQLPRTQPDAKTHVSGHTPMRRVRRYRDRSLVRVDTGACFGRRLSAWCAELDLTASVAAFV